MYITILNNIVNNNVKLKNKNIEHGQNINKKFLTEISTNRSHRLIRAAGENCSMNSLYNISEKENQLQ